MAGKVLSAWLSTSNEKSAFSKGAVGFPNGTISSQASLLHSNGAAIKLVSVNVQGASEKVTVNDKSPPVVGNATSLKT